MVQETIEAAPDLFSGTVRLAARPGKTTEAFKTISEAADMLSLPQHVLRFWESQFSQLKPLKLKGGRRYYRPQDIEALLTIKQLLYKDGYTIKGARRAIGHTRKHKEAPLMPPKSKRREPAPLEATPLFAALSPAAPGDAKKDELRKIQHELLELRDLVRALPSLP